MQDNAKPHSSNDTKKFFKREEIKLLEDWPPSSPDLNVIEIVWAIMGTRVEKLRPKNVQDLKKTFNDFWDSLEFTTINALIDSMMPRLRQVIVNKGWQIHQH